MQPLLCSLSFLALVSYYSMPGSSKYELLCLITSILNEFLILYESLVFLASFSYDFGSKLLLFQILIRKKFQSKLNFSIWDFYSNRFNCFQRVNIQYLPVSNIKTALICIGF